MHRWGDASNTAAANEAHPDASGDASNTAAANEANPDASGDASNTAAANEANLDASGDASNTAAANEANPDASGDASNKAAANEANPGASGDASNKAAAAAASDSNYPNARNILDLASTHSPKRCSVVWSPRPHAQEGETTPGTFRQNKNACSFIFSVRAWQSAEPSALASFSYRLTNLGLRKWRFVVSWTKLSCAWVKLFVFLIKQRLFDVMSGISDTLPQSQPERQDWNQR